MRQYTPRKAAKRWLQNAPEYVLDCLQHKKADGAGFDILFTGTLLGTVEGEPRDFAHVHIFGLDVSEGGAAASFELEAYQAAAFRYRNKGRRISWESLPPEVREAVTRWATTDNGGTDNAQR